MKKLYENHNVYIRAGRRSGKTSKLIKDAYLRSLISENKCFAVLAPNRTMAFEQFKKIMTGPSAIFNKNDFTVVFPNKVSIEIINQIYDLDRYSFIYVDEAGLFDKDVLSKIVHSEKEHYIVGTPHPNNFALYKLFAEHAHEYVPLSKRTGGPDFSEEAYRDCKKFMSEETFTNQILANYTADQIEKFENMLYEEYQRELKKEGDSY